jgi:hypothetical protein
MAANLITRRLRAMNAKGFYDSVVNTSSRLYVFFARCIPWANESSPPTPVDSIQNEQFDFYRDMISMKRVQNSDITFAALRYNWANNTLYTEYTDTDGNLSSKQFFVITSDRNVYKCIDNNYGANSTVKPTGTSTSITTTADGYRWKYMFTISTPDMDKFSSTNYIPVKTLSANDGSSQWTVQQAAANGAIHHIKVTDNGSGYHLVTNSFSAIVSNKSFTLGSYASAANNIYANSALYISSGLGVGQIRKIATYNGTTKLLTVNNAFTVVPNTSSKFIISPSVIIRGDSGSTVGNRATAYVSRPMNRVGGISRITMINEGLNYSTANAIFDASAGSGAAATPIISPPGIHGSGGLHGPGGHGSDPVAELYAHNVITSITVNGIESNTFQGNNQYRTVGLLQDPLLRGGPNQYANASVIDLTARLYVTSVSGDFTEDEVITGTTSKVKGRLVYFANTNTARTSGILKLVRVSTSGTGGYFVPGESVTGGSSGKTATVSTVARSAIKEYTGDVIYIENITPVARTPSQTETVKVLVKF